VDENKLLGGFPLTIALYPLVILLFLVLGTFAERYNLASAAVVCGVSGLIAYLLARPAVARLTSITCFQCSTVFSLKELRHHASTRLGT